MPIDDFSNLMTELSYRPDLFKREGTREHEDGEKGQQAPAQPRTV
jgi:hypothetical protein